MVKKVRKNARKRFRIRNAYVHYLIYFRQNYLTSLTLEFSPLGTGCQSA